MVEVESGAMTNFYSVLKASILRRDLRSPIDRRSAYDQARDAMSRKLWSFDPPLAEDEIDTRLGLFDSAIERIERDLERDFAEIDSVEKQQGRRRESRRAPDSNRGPTIHEGYDEDADYMPNYGERPSPRQQGYRSPPPNYRPSEYDMPPAPRDYDDRRPPREDNGDRNPNYGRPPPERGRPRAYADNATEADPYDDRYSDDGAEAYYYEDDYRENSPREPAYRPPAYQEPAEWRQAPSARGTASRRSPGRRDSHLADAFDDDDDDDHVARRPRKRSGQGGRKVVRTLSTAVAGLVVVLIGFNAFVFLPTILDTGSTPTDTAGVVAKSTDRLPTAGSPATRIVSDSATASEIPQRDLNVTESFVVFDGRDPTVFDGSSNNPIQFESDAEGGFARISSATSAAGARALIAPGLAERLAGQTIRITLLSRSSAENGASTIRFAYQSGLAVSHWQSVDLSEAYGSYGMIWRVPAAHASASGDILLIEPGIPGDGTSTDIRSIKIDIVAS